VLVILFASLISLSVLLVSAETSYQHTTEVIALTAIGTRDLADPQRGCDSCWYVVQAYFLNATIKSKSMQPQAFVAILEIRNHEDITQFLQLHQGVLDANGTSNIVVKWDKPTTGEFELRSFVISDLDEPHVLSSIRSALIKVTR
jgi:hypothetical protein